MSHLFLPEQFQRNLGVFTPEVQEMLSSKHVSIAGIGGPGRAVAEVLVRWGIGSLRIADFDSYDVGNINRQFDAYHSTIGKQKTAVALERLLDINPRLDLQVYPQGVTLENVSAFTNNTDAVVDALDYFSPVVKLELYKQARVNDTYVFSSPAAGFGALIFCFSPKGMTMEEIFDFPHEKENISGHHIPLAKLIGGEISYLPNLFYTTTLQIPPYVSTNSASVLLAGGVTAVHILRLFIAKQQRLDPYAFKEYGFVNPLVVPYALRIDAWDYASNKLVDLREV